MCLKSTDNVVGWAFIDLDKNRNSDAFGGELRCV